jgi:hypothetical protein
MPRYEIVAHVTRDLPCDTPEEAAAIVRRQLDADGAVAVSLLHLAVWREDPAPAASPLPRDLRHSLTDFFAAVERCASEAEEAFRGRVAAILAPPSDVRGE